MQIYRTPVPPLKTSNIFPYLYARGTYPAALRRSWLIFRKNYHSFHAEDETVEGEPADKVLIILV